jgi:hypothetical protein
VGTLNFTGPIARLHPKSPLERAITAATTQVLQDEMRQQLQDLVDYGAPHLGSSTVVERFTKQDGLVVLRRPNTADVLMRVIYANWASLASERGLNFLKFVLQMLWPDQWQIVQLYHSIPYHQHYPRFLAEDVRQDRFLTSRIRIRMADTVDRAELSELTPVLRRLVPANIIPDVVIDAPSEDVSVGVVVLMQPYHIWDFF